MKQLKILFLFIIGTTFVSCSLEEDFVKNQKSITLQDIRTNHISYSAFNRKIQFVKNKPNFDYMISQNIMAKSSVDTTDYVIYSDKITELVYNDYTSYTMLLKTPNSTKNVFYNIIFEIQNQNTTVVIVKYTKSDSDILEENITSFRASEDFTGGGSNLLQMYIDDFENGGVGGSIGTPTSTGSGGISWTGLGGSPIYPSNCNGTVSTTYVLEPHACYSGNHMPGQSCEFLNPSYQYYDPNKGPYYDLVPYYTCIENTTGENNSSPYDTGNTTGGNTTIPDDGDDSITGMIQPEECDGQLTGDINGDCMLSQYEMCILNGYPTEVCECIEQGGNMTNCLEDSICAYLQNLSSDANFIAAMQDMKNKSTTLNKEVGYTQKADNTNSTGSSYDYVEGNDNTGEIIWTIPSTTTLKGLFHTHYDIVKHLPVFSLDDMYALFQLFGPVFDVNGNVTFQNNFNMNYNFTFILVTAHGTKLALKFDNPESIEKLRLFGQKYFGDWEMDTSQMPQIPGITPITDREKISEEYDKYVKKRFDLEKQKKKFAEFLEELELGISLFQTNDSFTQWEKINKSGTPTPCNLFIKQ